jgi:hypothetical protein
MAELNYKLCDQIFGYLRFELLTVVVKISVLVFWVMTSCSPVRSYERFGGLYCLHIKVRREGGGDIFLQNTGNHLQDLMVPQPRRPRMTNIWLFEIERRVCNKWMIINSSSREIKNQSMLEWSCCRRRVFTLYIQKKSINVFSIIDVLMLYINLYQLFSPFGCALL